MTAALNIQHHFDAERNRQYLNGELTVFHCHHYASLFSQLADDAKMFEGARLLSEAAEEAFLPVLSKYFNEQDLMNKVDRTRAAEQYFAYVGLGQLSLNVDEQGGTAEMPYSHVDEGWLKKWESRPEPVNFIGQGYVAAALSAITGNPAGSFVVEETQSIVAGADSSKFKISKK